MMKLGFLLDNCGPSQLASSLISSGNQFVEKHPEADLVLFHSNINLNCVQPNFAVMDMAEAYTFDGALIATDLAGADFAVKCPGAFHRILYVWNLEWVYAASKVWENFVRVYANDKLDIVARSMEHDRAIQIAWGVEAKEIIENANVEDFYDFIKQSNKPLKRRTYVEGLFYEQR